MVSATRVISWRTPVSRSVVPRVPWRYLLATMFVAVIDQSLGTSTSFCSKMELPLESVMDAVRSSHSTSSYGETSGLVNRRRKVRPVAFFFDGVAAVVEVASAAVVGAPFVSTSDIALVLPCLYLVRILRS